jgi:4'-phosphopantetheinyl transferase EntD
MTRICPGLIPQACQELFAEMDALSLRFSSLATHNGQVALLDLTQLRPLIEQGANRHFLTTLLSPAEARLFAGFKYPKRRLEWLGGRLAAKHCLCALDAAGQMTSAFYRDYALLPDAHGRPALDAPGVRGTAIPAISISHSRGYAAALVTATRTCGIDIQRITEQLANVQERFAAADELALLHQVPAPLTRLGMIWTAKEAVKKGLLSDQSTFFGTIRLTEVSYEPKEATWKVRCQITGQARTTAAVRIAEFGDYLIACTLGERYA